MYLPFSTLSAIKPLIAAVAPTPICQLNLYLFGMRMDSAENQKPHQLQTPQYPSRTSFVLSKAKTLFVISTLILFLAIFISSVTKTNLYRTYLLKAKLLPYPNIYQEFLKFTHLSPVRDHNDFTEPPFCLLWMAPFLSAGGYSSEAWSYILALNNYLTKQKNPFLKLRIEQHGDLENVEFWEGLPLEMRNLAIELYQTECRLNQTLVICHSEPGAWYPPLFQTLPCPPMGYGKFKVVIGRTMFETDRVNVEHVRRCNKMDLVWVPTDFHVNAFESSGVDPTKLIKIVQPVDLEFFNPYKVEPLDLASIGSLVMGFDKLNLKEQFIFLSVFKWEYRKGWDVLLRSYLKEFSGTDEVVLYLLTNPYHSDSDFANKIVEYVQKSDLEKPSNGWASIYVIDEHIAQVDLPRLYKAANAFVLPSRGEGWGRPVVEAMAMSLPVITTNWSGPTEYLTDENSFPLPFEGMSEVTEGPFEGHLWAEPSVNKLQHLMRHVVSNPEEAKIKGLQARLDMMIRFSPDIVAQIVVDHLHRIVEIIG